jgi:hypothetical protein
VKRYVRTWQARGEAGDIAGFHSHADEMNLGSNETKYVYLRMSHTAQ